MFIKRKNVLLVLGEWGRVCQKGKSGLRLRRRRRTGEDRTESTTQATLSSSSSSSPPLFFTGEKGGKEEVPFLFPIPPYSPYQQFPSIEILKSKKKNARGFFTKCLCSLLSIFVPVCFVSPAFLSPLLPAIPAEP